MARGIPQFFHTAIDAAVAVINSRRNHALFSHQALAANLYRNQRYVDIRHRALRLQHPGEDRHWFIPMNRATGDLASEQLALCFCAASAHEIYAGNQPCECCSAA